MPDHHSIHRLFWLKLTRDIFSYSFVFWLLLLVMEIIKKGIVSNYLSLPHFALLIGLAALVHLAIRPADTLAEQKPSRFKPWQINTFLSVLAAVLILITVEASAALTILLVLVSTATIWVVMDVVGEKP